MTTVAYKDGVLAADRAASSDTSCAGTVRKIWKRKSDGALVGGTGRIALIQKWAKWFLDGERGNAPSLGENDDTDAEMIVVRPDGNVELHERQGAVRVDAPYFALGSGTDFALGAMACGAGARQAVNAASKHDNCTGRGVQFLRLGKCGRR